MKTKTHFTFRVDIWDDAGDSIVEHVAGADDFEWPKRSTGRRWRAGPQPGSPCGRARASYMRTGSADKRMQNPTGAVRGSEDDMRCPGCGAEMHLIEVAPDKTKMVSTTARISSEMWSMCSISSMYLCSRSRSADVMTWLPTTRDM